MAHGDKIDLVIIGAGHAGIAAALEAREAGASVVLIEEREIGDANNRGALAAHALAAAARRAHDIRTAKGFGVAVDEPRINFSRVNARVREVIATAAPDISIERLTALGIEVVHGSPWFSGRSTLQLGERTLKARRFIIATGARPTVPDIPGIDAVDYHTPRTIFDLTRKPGHLVVVGGGDTGIALAQSHLRLGCEVTLIDMLEPLRDHDPEMARVVLDRLKAEGLTILTNTGIVSVSASGGGVKVATKSGADEAVIEATHLLFATGQRPNIEGLGLETAGAKFGPRGVVLDSHLRTTNRRIVCIGEVTGLAHSVHTARFQARRAAGFMASGRPLAPRILHTDPPIAQVGLTEPEAMKRYKTRFEITRAQFSFTDKARATGHLEGHVKLITHASGRVLGASIAGPQADELIAIFALAIARRLTPEHLETLIVPYPAFAQIISELGAEYRQTHPLPPLKTRLAGLRRLLPW